MTGEAPLSMWGWPGPNATAGVQVTHAGERVLSIFLDPANLVITIPPFPDGARMIARFYRQLARACAQLSAELDPEAPSVRGPGAHRAQPSGGGS
jgi:hypothetical protein